MARVIVHVAQDAIRKNTKEGTNDPAIIVRRGSKPSRHHSVELTLADGTVVGTFIYSPHKPLSCGARLYLSVNDAICTVRPVETIDADPCADGQCETTA